MYPLGPTPERGPGRGREDRCMAVPETRYAKCGDLYIAYKVAGEGPIDLVFFPMWFSNIELIWQEPRMERVVRRLSSFARLIMFDQRGTGLSDPVAVRDLVTLEDRAKDVLAVLDAVGSDRAALFGCSLAAPLACFVAATHAERTSALILLNGTVMPRSSGGPEIGEEDEAPFGDVANTWATNRFQQRSVEDDDSLGPDDRRFEEWLAYYRRMSMGPGAAAALFDAIFDLDVRDVLAAIHVPTLVVHRRHNTYVSGSHGRYIAEHIAGARFVEVRGSDPTWAYEDPTPYLDEVEEFLNGFRPAPHAERVLSTLLFTDIVGSTEQAAQLGDRAWSELLAHHDAIARRTIGRYGGRVIDTAGSRRSTDRHERSVAHASSSLRYETSGSTSGPVCTRARSSSARTASADSRSTSAHASPRWPEPVRRSSRAP
jgi:pimeloyl-ACP methyl ester carboxylesterase